MKLGGDTTEGTVAELPAFLKAPFSAALSQSLLLPAFVALFGVVAALFLRGSGAAGYRPAPRDVIDHGPDELETFTAALRTHDGGHRFAAAGRHDDLPPADVDYFPDDDEYVEYTVEWDEEPAPETDAERTLVLDAIDAIPADDSLTEPMHVHVEHPLHAPAETWHSGPVESWHSLLEDDPEPQLDTVAPPPVAAETNGRDPWHRSLDELLADPPPMPADPPPEPIGFAHNGFHVDADEHLQVPPPAPPPPAPSSGGRHSRSSDEDAGTYGKHSMRFRD
jgi:hypothetical protein